LIFLFSLVIIHCTNKRSWFIRLIAGGGMG